jgi:hypothetical protein
MNPQLFTGLVVVELLMIWRASEISSSSTGMRGWDRSFFNKLSY